jgi:spermidine synthase
MSSYFRIIIFVIFILSGFCSLVYQIVWLRLALSSFGVITPIVSVVMSVFMLGLGIGTWIGSSCGNKLSRWNGTSILALYGVIEIIIGIGSNLVPELFATGYNLLLSLEEINSSNYFLLSSLAILCSLIPWCICMGMTLPLVLTIIKQVDSIQNKGFSFLYLANVCGAILGAFLTSFVFIELVGFKNSLLIAGSVNLGIGLFCLLNSNKFFRELQKPKSPQTSFSEQPLVEKPLNSFFIFFILFFTGFAAMALEIIWMRAFTPVLGTLVYSFAGLLTVYLISTTVGSFFYRKVSKDGKLISISEVLLFTTFSLAIPIFLGDPRILLGISYMISGPYIATVLVLLSIVPFCTALGFLTPMLIDLYSSGDPKKAGLSYAINVLGSILGPISAAYIFLPLLGTRSSMIVIMIFFIILLVYSVIQIKVFSKLKFGLATILLILIPLKYAVVDLKSFEEGVIFNNPKIRRDYAATVISHGNKLKKHLLVNGIGMTALVQTTKAMAHFPMVTFEKNPESALVIAFGMGTTFRSLLSWDIEVTAIELVPSVIEAFYDFFEDAESVMANPKGKIIIDDGRRFLSRTSKKYDLITVDPPPPVESAMSGLLYSKEFLELAKSRLKPGGILFHWFPVESATFPVVLQTIRDSFPYVRVFRPTKSFQANLNGKGSWNEYSGYHIFCSKSPIEIPSLDTIIRRIPKKALEDFSEWFPPIVNIQSADGIMKSYETHKMLFNEFLRKEISMDKIIDNVNEARVLDDRPYNEYFLLRKYFNKTG